VKKKKASAGFRIARMVIADILLAGIFLLTFAFFHHVLPAIQRNLAQKDQILQLPEELPQPEPPASTEQPTDTPEEPEENEPEEIPEEQPQEQPEEPKEERPPIIVPEIDHRTEWQKKFEEHFSDTVVTTENSYKSPTVSIEISTISEGEGESRITYYVADIYVAAPENITAYTANNELAYFSTQDALEMDRDSNALLSMTGDFYSYQGSGLLVRNGVVYMDDYTYCDICVMYPDGSIETYFAGMYNKEEILAKNPTHIWNFGPILLDENGKAMTTFNTSSTVAQRNPRSVLGYYEPGHYCFIVVDGRQPGHSRGMILPELAQLVEDLGCTRAYNMDGGGSALMIFNDAHYSSQSNGNRKLGDILIVRETEVTE